jgi:hypothetical protein
MDPDAQMDDKARLQLQKMIQANDVLDQTDLIRQLKHSEIFKKEIAILLELKEKYKNDEEQLNLEAMIECSFLFNYYTDIYNKIRKDEINLDTLYQFIDVLKKIEDGILDQHEASFMVGTLLKKMYVDSAIKKADKINEQYDDNKEDETIAPTPVEISWKEFKSLKNA